MDALTAMAIYARYKKTTYGKVQRMIETGKLTYSDLGVEQETDELPDYDFSKECAYCGRKFDPIHGSEKYCSDNCRLAVKRKKNREYMREYIRRRR